MRFLFKAFSDITYITKWFKEIICNNKTQFFKELRYVLKGVILSILI